MAYDPPITRSSGDLITAEVWNQEVSANMIAVAAGTGYPAQGRLTLESGVPVSTADQTDKTTVYYTPYNGEAIWLYDSSELAWLPFALSEISISGSATAASTPADVFVYNDAGSPALNIVNWTNGTTRATALTTLNGIYVKDGATTHRYVGTVCADAAGAQIDDTTIRRGVWNYYNRVPRQLYRSFTADRTRSNASYGEMNSEIQIFFVIGVDDMPAVAMTNIDAGSAASYYGTLALGLDSTTTPLVGVGQANIAISTRSNASLHGAFYAGIGYHYITILGRENNASGTLTCYYRADGSASPSTVNKLMFWG